MKAKQEIDRKSSIERSCRFGQSSGKIKAVITISVTSFYLPVSKENQLKTDEYNFTLATWAVNMFDVLELNI